MTIIDLAHAIAKQRGIKIKDALTLALEQGRLEKIEAEKKTKKIEKKQKQKSNKARKQER